MPHATLQTPRQMDFCREMPPAASIHAEMQGGDPETRINTGGIFEQICRKDVFPIKKSHAGFAAAWHFFVVHSADYMPKERNSSSLSSLPAGATETGSVFV